MSRYCLVIDLDRCIGCDSCMVSCKIEHEVALGQTWNKTLKVGPFGEYPHLKQYFLPIQCQQCKNAPCVEACPTGASYRDPETDMVLVDPETCIGCKLCLGACPYNVRTWDESNQRVTKCSLCKELFDKGEQPACVASCCGSARFFGDLDDPESDASKAIAAKPDAVHRLWDEGNEPATVYLLSEKYADWKDTYGEAEYGFSVVLD